MMARECSLADISERVYAHGLDPRHLKHILTFRVWVDDAGSGPVWRAATGDVFTLEVIGGAYTSAADAQDAAYAQIIANRRALLALLREHGDSSLPEVEQWVPPMMLFTGTPGGTPYLEVRYAHGGG